MGKYLVIAEKPSLSRTIQRATFPSEQWVNKGNYSEGNNFVCTHSFGHLFSLYDIDDYENREKTKWSLAELPYIPKEFKLKIKCDKNGKIDSGIKKQLDTIEKLMLRSDIDKIVVAGDKDSEGQKLIEEIVDYVFNKNKINKEVLRLWFTDQSEPSIRKDIKNLKPNSLFKNYANEAEARAKVDWIIGINMTRALSLICSSEDQKILLTTGRVLAAIVQKIYERYVEQQNFKPKKYFNIELFLNDKDNNSIILKDSLFSADEQLKAFKVLNQLNNSNTFVKEIEKKNVKKQAPSLFSLTTLQNNANKMYNLSSKQTLDLTQSLYEKGLVTYPRSDSEYLSDNDKPNVKKVIDVFKAQGINNIDFKESKHLFDTKKSEVHSAIIPTLKTATGLSKNEELVYNLIKNRFLANFCNEDCVIEESKLIIANSFNDRIAEMKGIRVLQQGFLVFENTVKSKQLPKLEKGERINANYKMNECFTKPPSNINAKELNNWMQSPFSKDNENEDEKYEKILEGLQIGTVATRADILNKAKLLNYIKEEKGVFTITDKGIYFIETSKKLNLLLTAEQTATLGKYLKGVHDNKITVDQCVSVIAKDVSNKIINAKNIKVEPYKSENNENHENLQLGVCPICGKGVYEGVKSFYCTGFKEHYCKFILRKDDIFLKSKGKTLTKTDVKKLLKDGQAVVKGLKKKDGSGTYDSVVKVIEKNGYYNITYAENTSIQKESLGVCPRCNKEHIYENKMTYYCSDKKCGFTLWKEDKFIKEKGIKLTNSMYKKLLEGKKILIKDIPSKKNDYKYNANLHIEDTGVYVNYKFELIKLLC